MLKYLSLTQRYQMAAKIKINETGDCIYAEADAIELLYNNPELDIKFELM